jgi:transposase
MQPFKLTSWQRQRLRRQRAETRDVRVYRRTVAVLEYDRGRPAAAIARMLGVSRQSIHNWVAYFARTPDPAVLADLARSGQPRVLDEDDLQVLAHLLAGSPQNFGYADANWTVPRLREALARCTGHTVSDVTLRRQLQAWEYVWKRPRYRLAPDPEREKKTADSAATGGLAAAQRGPRRGRDRPVALPAVAGRLGAARAADGGPAEWLERPARHLRRAQPADGVPAVAGAAERAQR